SVRFEKNNGRKRFVNERDKTVDRPLRIGYVSGDFGAHPVGFLLRDVMRHHDRQRYRIHCYSMMRRSDAITTAIRENADVWVDALLMTDDELTDRIHEDQIDILVDLSGHTAYNRLPVFVRKPAPVQATWIGYFHSTGLECIDYFITDPFTTPVKSSQLFSETPVWLPHTRFCYSSPDYAPDVAPPPARDSGRITFGSFNRLEKLVEPVVAAWADILKAIPDSRLLLKAGSLENADIANGVRRRFGAYGIDKDRLELRGRSSHQEMLAQYGDIDIALDPFPFNGGMTTLEALWMGVPIVTLAGDAVVSRQTASALLNLGLSELIFDDVDDYVQGAATLARDPGRLMKLRLDLRSRMSQSPICQPALFAHDLETLYRNMWQAWCQGDKLGTEILQPAMRARSSVLHVTSRVSDRKKIRLVCGTRTTQERFFNATSLGKSFSLYKELLPFLELQLFPENSQGLPTIYNLAIDHAKEDPATLVFIHDDVLLPDFFWTDQVEMALRNFEIVGVAGNIRRLPKQSGWAFIDDSFSWDSAENLSGIVAHGKGFPCNQIDSYGPSGVACKLLDGVMLIVDSETLIKSKLRFDPQFSFHFYDMDFCRQAELKGLRMGTWPISLIHESGGAFGSDSWRGAFGKYLEKYSE
ncbi:MAG TPA: hypothetical protein VJ654_09025, partial [Noviherbaspirillum sp.]|nr:hypothetical protein [Noviherbaspirillum sp.]